jgi:hypothetical protein
MSVFDRRREPQPIILPVSRREAASQMTIVDCSDIACSSDRCNRCSSVYELDAQFCGECGTRREQSGYTRLVSRTR